MDVAMQARIRDRMEIQDRGYSTPCWMSNRAMHSNGYTKIGISGRTELTHRASYMAFVGPIPDGLVIDHLCRQRACCNPQHLEPVSMRENLMRGDGFTPRQIAQTHCVHGHELSGENVYHRRDRTGRLCRECRAASGRRQNAKLRAQRAA